MIIYSGPNMSGTIFFKEKAIFLVTKDFGPFFLLLSSMTNPRKKKYKGPQAILTNTVELMEAFFMT